MAFQTLKFRFIAISLAVVAAGAALRFGVAVPYTQAQIEELVANQQLVLAAYIAHDIGRGVSARRELIEQLAATLPQPAVSNTRQFDEWVEAHPAIRQPSVDRLLLIDPTGKVIGSSPDLPAGSSYGPYGKAPWFQAVLKSPTAIGTGHEPNTNTPVAIIAARVQGATQHTTAVLVGVFPLASSGLLVSLQHASDAAGKLFAKTSDITEANKHGLLNATNRLLSNTAAIADAHSYDLSHTADRLLLVSPRDKSFIDSSDPSLAIKPITAGENPLLDRAMAGYRGTGITTVNGVKEMQAIVNVPDTGWFVITSLPAKEVLRPVRSLTYTALKGTLFGLLGILLFVLFIIPRMLRPLNTTAIAMRDIADGKRALEPLPIRRQDEVGKLILGFNYLVERLRAKEEALKDSDLKLSFLAHHDPLTGLYNRTMLEHRLGQELDNPGHPRGRFALLFCDLDGFKWINDTYGHHVGDAVLVQLAERFRQGCRAMDTVARLGGDEFVVLLTQLANPREDAARIAQHFLDAIGKPCVVDDNPFMLSVSIGIALGTAGTTSSSQVLSQADIAMYQAKRSGKNHIRFFDDAEPAINAHTRAPT
jgi:diguanylate cyclase (GGDEF)-like protein